MIRFRVDPQQPDPEALSTAVEVLGQGGIVAYPTESVYGLGACGTNESACRRIFVAKGRDSGKPLPLLIPEPTWLSAWCETNSTALKIARVYWPGGLTMVLKAKAHVPRHVLSDQGKVGLRIPSHPTAAALVRLLNAPLTATSANRSGQPGIEDGEQVFRELGEWVDLLLDGGVTPGRTPSTVLDVSENLPRVLRAGPLALEDLMSVLEHEDARREEAPCLP